MTHIHERSARASGRSAVAVIAALATSALIPGAASAASTPSAVAIANPTFETTGPLAPGQCSGGKHCTGQVDLQPGWTLNGVDTGVLKPGPGMYTAAWSGGNVAFVGGMMDGAGWFTQTLGIMPAGVAYTLAFDAGCRLDKPCGGYRADIYAGDFSTLVKSVIGGAPTQKAGSFQHVTLNFDSVAGKALIIRLTIAKKGKLSESQFDNVQLSAVPE